STLGKVGTKLAGNFSYWAGLDGEYNMMDQTYDIEFIGKGQRYFRDINVEIKNRWSSRWSSTVYFQDVIIDKSISKGGILGAQGDIRSQIAVVEGIRRFDGGKAVTLQ